MSNRSSYENLKKETIDLDLVQDAHIGEEYLYVESTDDDCTTVDFREELSNLLLEKDGDHSLEIRTKKNNDGFIAIVGDEVEHPIQKVTLYCGKLGLSDRYTYQIQVKTTNLVDDDVYDGKNPEAFALAVIQVLSTAFDFGPYDPDELSSDFDVKKKEMARYVSTIIENIEE